MKAYDVTYMTPGGVEVLHQTGAVTTDGPWLILYADSASYQASEPSHIIPAHAVASVVPCEGGEACRGGRS